PDALPIYSRAIAAPPWATLPTVSSLPGDQASRCMPHLLHGEHWAAVGGAASTPATTSDARDRRERCVMITTSIAAEAPRERAVVDACVRPGARPCSLA